MSMRRIQAVCTVSLLALHLHAGPVRAQEAETATRTVHVGDLDLATPVGRAEMRHRVALAARRVCGDAPMTLAESDAFDACRAGAIAAAEPRLRVLVTRAAVAGVEVADTGR